MVLLTALRTCTGQLIDPFIGQNLLPRIQSWRQAVTEMPNCWEMPAWRSQPDPSAEAQVHPDPFQGLGEQQRGKKTKRRAAGEGLWQMSVAFPVWGRLTQGKLPCCPTDPRRTALGAATDGSAVLCGEGESWAHSKAFVGVEHTTPSDPNPSLSA